MAEHHCSDVVWAAVSVYLQLDPQLPEQADQLLQLLEALLGQLRDGRLLLGQGVQQGHQLPQLPLLLDELVQSLQLMGHHTSQLIRLLPAIRMITILTHAISSYHIICVCVCVCVFK